MEIRPPQKERIRWYRTQVSPDELRAVHERSDLKAWAQTLGYFGLIGLTGALTVYGSMHWAWWQTALMLFFHGTFMSFTVNPFHELVHGTVFKTKWLNGFFCKIIAFLGWHNPIWFWASHTQHHIYTLHPPDDSEVVLPMKMTLKDYLKVTIVNPWGLYWAISNNWKTALGFMDDNWTQRIFPENRPEDRMELANWSRFVLLGHLSVLFVSIITGWWMVFVVVSCGNFIGNWLFIPCNQSQHIGLMDKAPDFRLSCRTMLLNPFFQFLYWHMNYHIEHHMYAAVPCYNLGKLHELIRQDLPQPSKGLISTWTHIGEIQERQKKEPGYQFRAELPSGNA